MAHQSRAIYFFSLTTLQRRKGRSFVQVAAYVTGERLESSNGQTFGRKSSEALIRWGLHGSARPLNEFANLTENAERRCDSTVGRHVIVALPRGLSDDRMLGLAEGLADAISKTCSVPVVFALHRENKRGDEGNPHAHLLFGGRPFDDATGCFARKRFRDLDNAKSGAAIVEFFRERWAQLLNSVLPDSAPKVTHLSYARQGLLKIAQRHLGPNAAAAERKGVRTAAGDRNRLADEINELDRQITALTLEKNKLMEQEAEEMLAPLPKVELQRAARRPASSPQEPMLVVSQSDISEFDASSADELLVPILRSALVGAHQSQAAKTNQPTRHSVGIPPN